MHTLLKLGEVVASIVLNSDKGSHHVTFHERRRKRRQRIIMHCNAERKESIFYYFRKRSTAHCAIKH